jgi:signal transduction histidine kinase/CheY-like chemotaxis protein
MSQLGGEPAFPTASLGTPVGYGSSPEPDFRTLFEAVPGLYLILDPELNIVAVSDAYLAATMTRREEILLRHIFDVFPDNPEDASATGEANLRQSLERVREQLAPDTMAVQKYDIQRPADEGGGFEVRYWSSVNNPILDDRGRLQYILYRVVDVTEFVRLKEHDVHLEALTEELRERTVRMEAEIVRRSVELQRTNEELRAASSAKNDFLSLMSHELRSPLASILGFGELLELSSLDEQQTAKVTMILKAGKHLLSLINDVLDLSRIESGQISISLEPVALQPLVDDALALMRPLADARAIAIRPTEIAPGLGYAIADNQRLKQIVINLISNAVKYNREGGTVAISISAADDDRVRISIADTGAGLDEAQRARLFVPFERLEAASAGIEGTGLGLALSRTLIEAMGGMIGVESVPGEGSCFWVELTVSEPAAVHEGELQSDELFSVAAYPTDRKLLYIEDTVANVLLIEGVLDRRPSVRLIPAMLGQLGLDLARQHRPDLVLLDLHLPDIPGEDVLARLRNDPATRGIPVAILSADATRDREQLVEAGAQIFLTKPIALRDLLETLDRFMA